MMILEQCQLVFSMEIATEIVSKLILSFLFPTLVTRSGSGVVLVRVVSRSRRGGLGSVGVILVRLLFDRAWGHDLGGT